MSSGNKGNRSNKGNRGGTNRTATGGGTVHSQSKSDHNHNEKDKDSLPHKITPTAEQLRIAQMIDNTHSEPEKVRQEKINQVMQVTSVSSDDAMVALHDCDYDVTAAIYSLIEGEDQGEWRESTKKKKKAPAAKTKEESESNKENRRVENRERSGSKPRGGGGGGGGSGPPRFRGRGGGRGNKEENTDGIVGRGSGSRRGKMANGTAPVSRGRGGRGRGGSSVNSRTFQKRQPPTFTETIDTWGAPTEKIDNSANDLQIDNWDEETSGTTEDWDSEWTGKTTVFGPSTGSVGPVPVANVQENSISNSVPSHSVNMGSMGPVIGSSGGSADLSPGNRVATNSLGSLQQSLSESVSNVLSIGQSSQLSNSSQSYSSVAPPSTGSMTQSQAIDLAALLQKAAPHSTLGRMPPPMVDGSSLGGAGSSDKSNLLNAISASVNSGGVPSVSSVSSQPYSSSSISNSMFSNSVSSLGNSLSSGTNVNKVLGLSSQNSNLASRSKTQSRRSFQSSSKIPASAVEMPEVAMAALDMQFTGLEFGTETFDFTSEVKPVMGNSLGGSSSVNARDPTASVAKDLSSLNSSMQQPSLGPQPIPFPTQASERKPPSASLLSGGQRPPSGSTSAVSQNLAELTKKENPPSGGPLGSLVGSSSSSGHSGYQPSSGVSYGSKSSSTFPNPPSAHYAPNPSQSYSNSSSTGVSNNNYGGSNSSSGSSGTTAASNQNSGGYGSSFSAASGQYPNNYVNASSHSLASISVPKTQTLTGLKDTSQNYNDSSAGSSHLSGALSTSATAGGSSGLSSSINSVTSSSVQPTKSSVPGKASVNSLGSGVVPPSVQQHQVAQQQLNQHHQSHHHLQQQVAQQTQLMAGPGHSQYVSAQAAALQGTMPPAFYNVQQPAMYSFEDLQMFQRLPHMQQAPTTLTGGRDGAITSPASYSVGDAAKFRTDQNSSPVASTINQQGAAAAGTYITATQNAAIPPYYMYQAMPAVPSNFTQYGTPTIPVIQIPPNTHTGSTTNQFPGPPPKLPYGGGSSTYYDSMSQTQDYKSAYGSGSQGQNKTGPNSTGSASNSGSDLSGYKNHLAGKVSRYEKQAFHTPNQPTFNLAGSGSNPMAANYAPMFIPTMPPGAQHHSTMMHHQLVRSNQMDGGSSAGQRTSTGAGQNKGGSKPPYSNSSYWGN